MKAGDKLAQEIYTHRQLDVDPEFGFELLKQREETPISRFMSVK